MKQQKKKSILTHVPSSTQAVQGPVPPPPTSCFGKICTTLRNKLGHATSPVESLKNTYITQHFSFMHLMVAASWRSCVEASTTTSG